MGFRRFFHGAKQRTKSATGVGIAPNDVTERRVATCLQCPALSGTGHCEICGCPIRHKTRMADEHCPKGFW